MRQILLQQHHVLGRALDPELTIVLCLNHHALVHDHLRRGCVSLEPHDNALDRQISRSRALAVFFHDAADAEDRTAASLENFAEFFDAEFPTWRDRWKDWK